MFKELENIIDYIQIQYIQFNEKWQTSLEYRNINLKQTLVKDILNSEELLNLIFNYREFINENNIKLLTGLNQFNTEDVIVNNRVKLRNSIEDKIRIYNTERHEYGLVPINKCFNDLFGVRMICKQEVKYKDVEYIVRKKDYSCKCIDSSKGDYKATHIYFKEGNNAFPWELQVWNKCDEMNNIISHKLYKQGYAVWEKENKGGGV